MKSINSLGGAALLTVAMAFAMPANAGGVKEIGKGALIGGAGGAVVGAVVPGISTGEGALIGAAGGAVVGALDKGGKKWHRDSRGRKYYVDKQGRRRYK